MARATPVGNDWSILVGLVSGFCGSCFFSSALPRCTHLQRPQGCLPSNVLTNALEKVVLWEYFTTIPTQAMDCRNAQCVPSESVSINTTVHLEKRTSTAPQRKQANRPVKAQKSRPFASTSSDD